MLIWCFIIKLNWFNPKKMHNLYYPSLFIFRFTSPFITFLTFVTDYSLQKLSARLQKIVSTLMGVLTLMSILTRIQSLFACICIYICIEHMTRNNNIIKQLEHSTTDNSWKFNSVVSKTNNLWFHCEISAYILTNSWLPWSTSLKMINSEKSFYICEIWCTVSIYFLN